MARHRTYRNKSRRNRTHRNRNYKNIINKTVDQSVSVVKSTSRKYMPKVKSGLENVGSKVVKTGEQSVPFLQQMTRKFFSMFSGKTKKNRKY
jgi:hypothetical protein